MDPKRHKDREKMVQERLEKLEIRNNHKVVGNEEFEKRTEEKYVEYMNELLIKEQ